MLIVYTKNQAGMPDDKDFREVLLTSNPAKTVLLPALQVGALSGKHYVQYVCLLQARLLEVCHFQDTILDFTVHIHEP